MINRIDKDLNHVGYIYVISFNKFSKDWRVLSSWIKLGSTRNPIMRLACHQYKNYKDQIGTFRITRCHDYLRCEAELKKLTGGKEEIREPNNLDDLKKVINKFDKIIDRFKIFDLDNQTVRLLLDTDSLKKYFKYEES